VQVSFIHSIHQIDPAQWDGLWNCDYPFTRHAFFAALEDSGSTRSDSGWQPWHALLKQDGKLIGVMPLFMKSHSYGEYVFDWAWADAYAQHHLNYYPKLVNAIPFTPSTGPRLALAAHLSRSGRASAMQRLQESILAALAEQRCSGWHCLFPDAQSQELLMGLPLIRRYGSQFHWFNQGFTDFDDYLSHFNSRKRKNLNKERRKVTEAGLRLRIRSGRDLDEDDWTQFYKLYHRTYLKRSGSYGYLGSGFFQLLAQAMPDQVVLISAELAGTHAGAMVAGAFYLRDSQTLYGRYWGALEEYDALHFEACFYQGIEYAIQEKLQRFDPGAQGEHKIQRGFTPIKTCSYHWLAEPRFSEAVAYYCSQEARQMDAYIADARTYLPFHREIQLPPVDFLLSPNCQ
jgi:predicted N-acyltransferase